MKVESKEGSNVFYLVSFRQNDVFKIDGHFLGMQVSTDTFESPDSITTLFRIEAKIRVLLI